LIYLSKITHNASTNKHGYSHFFIKISVQKFVYTKYCSIFVEEIITKTNNIMENFTQVRVELDIQAQKMISQYMINNEKIEKEIESGIKNAFERIDLEKEVEQSVKNCIQEAIKKSGEWGKIRDAVKIKTDEIVENYIEKSIAKFKFDFK